MTRYVIEYTALRTYQVGNWVHTLHSGDTEDIQVPCDRFKDANDKACELTAQGHKPRIWSNLSHSWV